MRQPFAFDFKLLMAEWAAVMCLAWMALHKHMQDLQKSPICAGSETRRDHVGPGFVQVAEAVSTSRFSRPCPS